MSERFRLSPQTVLVLDAFLGAPRDWRYGYDISRDTGLKSGTLYPILMRLADNKLVEASWETTEAGRRRADVDHSPHGIRAYCASSCDTRPSRAGAGPAPCSARWTSWTTTGPRTRRVVSGILAAGATLFAHSLLYLTTHS
jgi:hypothetical protein